MRWNYPIDGSIRQRKFFAWFPTVIRGGVNKVVWLETICVEERYWSERIPYTMFHVGHWEVRRELSETPMTLDEWYAGKSAFAKGGDK